MPIYEFFCDRCNTVFSFFSKSINTAKRPSCPRCGKNELERFLSKFSISKRVPEKNRELPASMVEKEINNVLSFLSRETRELNKDDPKQAAQFMRRISEMTELNLGKSMQDALARLEAGEDPEKIEEEIGDFLDEEEISFQEKKEVREKPQSIGIDETLYEL